MSGVTASDKARAGRIVEAVTSTVIGATAVSAPAVDALAVELAAIRDEALLCATVRIEREFQVRPRKVP